MPSFVGPCARGAALSPPPGLGSGLAGVTYVSQEVHLPSGEAEMVVRAVFPGFTSFESLVLLELGREERGSIGISGREKRLQGCPGSSQPGGSGGGMWLAGLLSRPHLGSSAWLLRLLPGLPDTPKAGPGDTVRDGPVTMAAFARPF